MFHVQNVETPNIPHRTTKFPRVRVGAPSVAAPMGVGAVTAMFWVGLRRRRMKDAILVRFKTFSSDVPCVENWS